MAAVTGNCISLQEIDPRHKSALGMSHGRDSGTILFQSRQNDSWQITRICAEGGQPEFTGLEVDGLIIGGGIDVSPDGRHFADSTTKRTDMTQRGVLLRPTQILRFAIRIAERVRKQRAGIVSRPERIGPV